MPGQVLTLEECRIQLIHADAFFNLPNLRVLRLDGNLLFTIPSAVVLPSLTHLSFRGVPEMFLEERKFHLPDFIFFQKDKPMVGLKSLAIVGCNIGAIRATKFKGLDGLRELVGTVGY